MPGMDGTGPMGIGPMTGKGLGICTNTNAARYGAGFGMGLGFFCRRGFGSGIGRGFAVSPISSKTQKELLLEQKNLLQQRIQVIDEQLESM